MLSLENVKEKEYALIDEIRKNSFRPYEKILANYSVNKSKSLFDLKEIHHENLHVYKIMLDGTIIGGVYVLRKS